MDTMVQRGKVPPSQDHLDNVMPAGGLDVNTGLYEAIPVDNSKVPIKMIAFDLLPQALLANSMLVADGNNTFLQGGTAYASATTVTLTGMPEDFTADQVVAVEIRRTAGITAWVIWRGDCVITLSAGVLTIDLPTDKQLEAGDEIILYYFNSAPMHTISDELTLVDTTPATAFIDIRGRNKNGIIQVKFETTTASAHMDAVTFSVRPAGIKLDGTWAVGHGDAINLNVATIDMATLANFAMFSISETFAMSGNSEKFQSLEGIQIGAVEGAGAGTGVIMATTQFE